MTTAKNGVFARLGVKEAVKWLIDSKEECNQKLQFQAELKGLLPPTKNEQFWKCDGERLTFFLKLRTRSASLLLNGAILLGLGELVARSHADERLIYHRLQSIFQSSYPEFKRLELLKSALDLAAVHQKRPTKVFEQITVGSSLNILNWDDLGKAKNLINLHHPIGLSEAYGIWFLTRMTLHNAPQRIRWLSEEADRRGLLHIVVNTVSTECSVSLEAARSALQTGVPFYLGFGLSMLYGTDGFKGWSSSQADNILSENGVPLYGRMRASAFMLKEAVHSWYRQKNRPESNRRRQTLLRIEPKYASGGTGHASQEIIRLEEEEKKLVSRCEEVEKQLQDALECAAMLDKEPNRYWRYFEPALLDAPEIYYRFAIAHPSTGPRTEALKQSIKRFDMIVGIRDPNTKFDANLDYHENVSELAFWAAKTQFELADIDGQDVGYIAVRRITRLEEKLRCFTTEPFASSRYGERFQNALHRWAVALEFTAYIALLDKKRPFERLRTNIAGSIKLFLQVADTTLWDRSILDRVCRPLSPIVSTGDADNLVEWINDETLPYLFRALLIWSKPTILENKLNLARLLADEVANRPASADMSGSNASNLLFILDSACTAVYLECRPDLIPHLQHLYDMALAQPDCPFVRSLDFATISNTLIGCSEARKQLEADYFWSQSLLSDKLKETC